MTAPTPDETGGASAPGLGLLERLLTVFGGKAALMGKLNDVVIVREGRRDGKHETRVSVNWRVPAPPEPDTERPWELDKRQRFHVSTAEKRLLGWSGSPVALETWNQARKDAGVKGRALLVRDTRDAMRVAAIMSWHYEAKPARGRRRPHLMTAVSIPHGIDPYLRAEYLVAVYLLNRIALVIDAKSGNLGRVGVQIDSGIDLHGNDLRDLGWREGPKSDGWKGSYFVLDR